MILFLHDFASLFPPDFADGWFLPGSPGGVLSGRGDEYEAFRLRSGGGKELQNGGRDIIRYVSQDDQAVTFMRPRDLFKVRLQDILAQDRGAGAFGE